MYRAREMASKLNLDMKIGDVEFREIMLAIFIIHLVVGLT